VCAADERLRNWSEACVIHADCSRSKPDITRLKHSNIKPSSALVVQAALSGLHNDGVSNGDAVAAVGDYASVSAVKCSDNAELDRAKSHTPATTPRTESKNGKSLFQNFRSLFRYEYSLFRYEYSLFSRLGNLIVWARKFMAKCRSVVVGTKKNREIPCNFPC